MTAHSYSKVILLDCPHQIVETAVKIFSENLSIQLLTVVSNEAVGEKQSLIPRTVSFWEVPELIMRDRNKLSLSTVELHHLQPYETVYRELETRWQGFPQKVVEQDSNFRFAKAVNWWLDKFVEMNVGGLFAFYPPHTIASYPAYIAAKLKGIPFLFLDVAKVLEKYLFFSCSFSNRNGLLEKENLPKVDLEGDLQRLKENLANGQYKGALPESLSRSSNQRSQIILQELKAFGRALSGGMTVPSFVYFSSKELFAFKRQRQKLQFWKFRWLRKLEIQKLKSFYRKSCCALNEIRQPFVYFGLHLHPEATTLPIACESRNWLVCAELLLCGIPQDHLLVIKINPVQISQKYFQPSHYSTGISIESMEYLAEKANVRFVDERTDSLELIQKSVVSATINGTLAVESILLQKRCLIFGDNWYSRLPGITKVRRVEDVKNAFLESKRIFPGEKLHLLVAMEYLFEPSNLDRKQFNKADVELLRNSFSAFIERARIDWSDCLCY